MKIEFVKKNEKYLVEVSGESWKAKVSYPVLIQKLHGRQLKARYDSVNGSIACAQFEDECGNSYMVEDHWHLDDGCVRLDRKLRVEKADKPVALRWTIEMRCKDENAANFDDYQFIVPGSFYNKNDTDFDGQDDYLGTFSQDYKDDRNPQLSVTGYCPKSGTTFGWMRADLPVRDVTLTREQLNARHFVHDTDIGSLGFAPSEYDIREFVFRCDYPFFERTSFCLNVDGSGWAAYKEMSAGDEAKASYLLFTDEAESLTEAGWKVTSLVMDRILNDEVPLCFTLEEARTERRRMTDGGFRHFPDKKGHPAGYFVHFSPRKKYGEQNLLEYGFSGAQAMVAYSMLNAAKLENNPDMRKRALMTLDFFVDNMIEPSGLPNGTYDVDNEKYVYWWTGILFPFQYSSSRDQLVNYLGEQIVDSLIDVAKELKKVKGNYCRSMSETMQYLLMSYSKEKEAGVEHPSWLDAVVKFCDKMVEIQNEDGSWNRGYTMDGEPIHSPASWFGANKIERGSGTFFPVYPLVLLHQHTGDKRYLESAVRGANFIRKAYVEDVTYLGGLNDTTHIKSVKIDAVGVMYAMRAMLSVYEVNRDPQLLVGARDAARILATWTYFWDIPFDNSTLLGKHDFKTTGWAPCDVIPAGSYVDDEFPEFVPDLVRIAQYCKDLRLIRLAKIVTRGMQHGLSMPQNMYGYAMPGVQCEGFLTSLWLSDTDTKEFSGAAAKNKGDDNDTCNGLTNPQALINLDWLDATFGTLDFDQIIAKVME